jgi:formate C-acetyltransferase
MTQVTISPRIMGLRQAVAGGAHKRFRTGAVPDAAGICQAEGLSWPRRASRLLRLMCENETPVILPGEKIVFTRTIPEVPLYYTGEQWRELFRDREIHESGIISNICADWAMVLDQGLEKRKQCVNDRYAAEGGEKLRVLAETVTESIDAVLGLAERYREEALKTGEAEIAETLGAVPAGPARTFREALQSLKFIHSALWLCGHYHVGLGRFDQYMWKYAQADTEAGRLTWEEVMDLTAEFFISLNKDSDLYPGIQQGDNGQSMMLGGTGRDGKNAVNPLTYLILDITRIIRFIDPKINLRINADTPRDLLLKAVELTKIGLGFPQYSNDEVIIPGLVNMGYEVEDVRDYSVAACWEFIIPGKGMDVVNIGAVSFPYAADRAIRETLTRGDDFSSLMKRCREDI